jgi:hypothetical protein
VTIIKDVLNALFFVIVSVITVLTYRRAKKTILQPLRTEVFKQQIQLFSDLLKLFVGKGEMALKDAHAFEKMLVANLHYQLDTYYRLRFHLVVSDEKERPYNRQACPISMIALKPNEVKGDRSTNLGGASGS